MVLSYTTLYGQVFQMQSQPLNKAVVGIKFQQPSFAIENDLTFLSGMYDLSANIPLSTLLNLELSLSYGNYESKSDSRFDGIGNLYLGFQIPGAGNEKIFVTNNLGLFIPTAENSVDPSALYLNSLTDAVGLAKSIPDYLTAQWITSVQSNTDNTGLYGFELGLSCFQPTGELTNDFDTELFINYGIKGGVQIEKLSLFTEIVGLGIISESDLNLEERFISTLQLGFIWEGRNFQPGIFFKTYFQKEDTDVVDHIIGFQLDFII